MEKVREVTFYKHYFKNFFDGLSPVVKNKVDHVLFLLTHIERIPEKFLKHIEGQKGLYELRIEQEMIYSEYSAVLIRRKSLFCSMVFKRKRKKRRPKKLPLQ